MLAMLQENIGTILTVVGFWVAVFVAWTDRARVGLRNIWQVIGLCCVYYALTMGSTALFVQMERAMIGVSAAGIFGVFFITAPVLLLILRLGKLNVAAHFDLFAQTSLVNMFAQRLICCFIGCCGGVELFSTGMDWPVREIELICDVVLFLVFLRIRNQNKLPGQMFPLLMIWFSAYRFVIEWFRHARVLGFGLHLAHIWGMIGFIIGLSIYFELRAQANKTAGMA